MQAKAAGGARVALMACAARMARRNIMQKRPRGP
jgi:hypothetical protein